MKEKEKMTINDIVGKNPNFLLSVMLFFHNE
ncbi:hypothetical protein SAMN05444350_1125 [Bacteroides stercorirosoris]|jgi:hypothetical protein|uniref:Uncharacterized protein n=1 Tax=Bacteroides stercorirosoris TaxID=871324 RepID=A0A1M6FFB2_9BACE|nr:hypothetical protein SAMN05444350_1125 [Bacteroides stercorirosoris]